MLNLRSLNVKHIFIITCFCFVLFLSACAPKAELSTEIKPTLLSVTVPQTADGDLVLQGRYFGDGQRGAGEESYVILGADISGKGGVRVVPDTWSPSKIVINNVPSDAGFGYAYVVVDGTASNSLPANLP